MISNIEPQLMWKNFVALNEVPRPSKKEERVIAFIKNFGEKLKLETIEDETGNVLIKKAASPGMEDRKTVILQSHLDMVHQKNNDTQFDFDQEGIKMFQEGDWVKAEGTTLGADNGIGVASIMALLESKDIDHPAIEALFTIDEETGMTGAFGLQAGFLKGEILLNLDTEDDDELTIGCAGGINVSGQGDYELQNKPDSFVSLELVLNGLSGGHSGMDIHKGLGNANKLMNRLLMSIGQETELLLHRIEGGGLRNAIPRESKAWVAVSNQSKAEAAIVELGKTLKAEYAETDPDLAIEAKVVEISDQVCSSVFVKNFTASIYAIPVGIYRMSPTVAGMVQTSNNLAQVKMADGKFEILCLCRSSVDSEKLDEVNAISSAMAIINAKVDADGDYPGWTPRPQSDIVDIMSNLYKEMFNAQPKVMACHAGLECGIIGSHYPNMDMVSFGPNIRGAHSPDEKVQISSVQKYWAFLLETLKRIPKSD
ncbi:MAG: cytosol nonspecific dipeptidase [Verrucomicrobia bacterium]|nr:cytosol nonspecific dipeptidase [Verrucomicrobiota bacterium]